MSEYRDFVRSLARKVEKYWHDRGYTDVRCSVVETSPQVVKHGPEYKTVSNLVNGLPPGFSGSYIAGTQDGR